MKINKDQLILTIVTIVAILYLSYSVKTNCKQVVIIKDTVYNEFVLSENGLYDELISQGIKYPKIVLKQAILETGHFKSKNCLDNKNLFGFYNGNRYLKFNTYYECIVYCKKWQDRNYKSGNYYQFLKDLPYAEDSTYIEKLKKIKINV